MARMEPHVQLLALALLNQADDHGYFMASPQAVRGECCPFIEDSMSVHGWLTELVRIGWIEIKNHPEQGPIGRIVKFAKHQVVNRPSDSAIKSYWFTEDSVRTHGGLTEDSVQEGNKEGKREEGRGKGAESAAPTTPPLGCGLLIEALKAAKAEHRDPKAIEEWITTTTNDCECEDDQESAFAASWLIACALRHGTKARFARQVEQFVPSAEMRRFKDWKPWLRKGAA